MEDLRRHQKQDQDRIRALEKLLSSMDQNLKQSVEVSRRETERSSTCCETLADLETRLASVEVHLRSSAGAYEVIKGRLDKELSGGGGGGKGRVTEDRLNGRLREVEKRLNNTVRKAEQRCSNTGSNLKEMVQREVTQIRNMVLSRLDDHAFKIGKVELDLTVLGDTVTDHSGRLGRLENTTFFLDRRLASVANICSEACGPGGPGGRGQKTEDTVKSLEWRVVYNEEEIYKFDTRLRNLSVSGDSLLHRVNDLTEDVKKIQGVTGKDGEHFTHVLTEVETLGRDVDRCSTACGSVERDLRAFSNSTGHALSGCREGLEDLRRRLDSEDSACSQVCSDLQEEVGKLKEEVEEACSGRCEDLREDILRGFHGELGDALDSVGSLNASLQDALWTLREHGHVLVDLTTVNDDIISNVRNTATVVAS